METTAREVTKLHELCLLELAVWQMGQGCLRWYLRWPERISCLRRQDNEPFPKRDVHALIPQNLGVRCLTGKRDSADVIKVIALEMGRLSWISQVGPI